MDKKHKELLSAAADREQLNALAKKHRMRGDTYDLKEVVETFPRKSYEQLWAALHEQVADLIDNKAFDASSNDDGSTTAEAKAKAKSKQTRRAKRKTKGSDEDEEENDEQDEMEVEEAPEEDEEKTQKSRGRKRKNGENAAADVALEYLRSVALLAQLFIASKDRIAPENLCSTVILLHDILLDVHGIKGVAAAMLLHNDIAQVCELWWKQDRAQKELLAPQTISYLIIQALEEGAKAGNIKRLYEFRSALLLLDFQDESSALLKNLLLRCLIHPMFLRAADGKKFLVYLFGLYPPFIDAVHETIKAQIPACPKSLLEAYGEIYFKAWKVAQGPYLLKLEYTCLQDLISCAVHVQNDTVVSNLRKVLRHIHEQKKQKGVDEMLLRLYEPIIWRSLKVANPLVRRNATTLLAEAFPLQDPDASQRDTDELLQKQFNQFEALLNDDVPIVRSVAVQAVCRILGVFWELIPAATIRTLLTKLISDCAKDKSSSTVRQAVFEGLRYLLDNHLSQPVLKSLLPQLSPLIHDTAERVRVSFIDLLCEIKTIRAIRFYDIVPIEHLLTRLEQDSPNIRKKLTKLLLNSYFPLDRKGSVQAKRCIILLQGNAKAGVHFYSNLRHYVAAGPLCKFIGVLYKLLCKCIERANTGEAATTSTTKGKGKRAHDEDEKANEISAKDIPLMESILEVMHSVWDSILPDLRKEENKAAKTYLKDTFNDEALEKLTTNFTSPKAHQSILRIASNLPKSNLTRFASSSLAKLKKLHGDDDTAKFEPLLGCLFAWKYEADVIRLIKSWLDSGIAKERSQKQKSKKSGSKGKKGSRRGKKTQLSDDEEDTAKSDTPGEAAPIIAMRLLSLIMEKDAMREKLFKRFELSTGILDSFRCYLTIIENRFVSEEDKEADEEEVSDELLFRVMDLLTRFLLHAFGSEDPQWREKSDEVLSHLLTWANDTLLPSLQANDEGVDEEDAAEAFAFTDKLAKVVAILVTELVAFGLCDQSNIGQAVELTKGLLSVQRKSFIESLAIPITSRLLYQLFHEGSNEDIATNLFMFVLEVIPSELQSNLRPFMSELFSLYHHRGNLSILLHPLLKKFVMQTIEIPDKPSSLARSLSHLPHTPAFIISSVMRSSAAVASLAELLDETLAQLSADDDDESNLHLLWRALEVLSVMIDNEDVKNKSIKGKQADLSPLQNCLIGIVSKTRLSAEDEHDNQSIDLDEDRALSAAVVYKLAEGLLKQSMGGDIELDDPADSTTA